MYNSDGIIKVTDCEVFCKALLSCSKSISPGRQHKELCPLYSICKSETSTLIRVSCSLDLPKAKPGQEK